MSITEFEESAFANAVKQPNGSEVIHSMKSIPVKWMRYIFDAPFNTQLAAAGRVTPEHVKEFVDNSLTANELVELIKINHDKNPLLFCLYLCAYSNKTMRATTIQINDSTTVYV